MRPVPTCTYLRCTEPPIVELVPKWSRVSWFGCLNHQAAMRDALTVGVPTQEQAYTSYEIGVRP